MLEVSNIRLSLDAGLSDSRGRRLVRQAAACSLGVSEQAIKSVCILKRSVDARKKSDVHFQATLGVELTDAESEKRILDDACVRDKTGAARGVHIAPHIPYKSLEIPTFKQNLNSDRNSGFQNVRPVVIGAGPAGLFCALYLARAGLHPLVLERGGDARERLVRIAAFEKGADLDLQTNIQFGEGGAGTFSDGKLTTNIKNPLTRHVLHWFVQAGAPQEILWQAKPHIGTDLLTGVVQTLRKQIIAAGGEVRFHAHVTGFRFEGVALAGIDVCDAGVSKVIPAQCVVLACGHSARDTFEALYAAGVVMQQKPFSVGVRIEHKQSAINRAQYGMAANHSALGAADYKLAVHLPNGRHVYTFCMCPGGQVVCAASEAHGVVVNGMSRFARDTDNANSALLVGVNPEDFGSNHPLAGVEFQRRMERAAYETALCATGVPYTAPAQTVGDFLACRPSDSRALANSVQPTYARGVAWCNMRDCLPDFVAAALSESLPLFDKKIRGFADRSAVITGVETRSSSPVCVVRNENYEACMRGVSQKTSHSGLYPCGEGAGYAGGIMSAACDGLRVAQALTYAYTNRQTA